MALGYGVRIKPKNGDKKKRTHKDKSDKALQAKMEGKNTPFQRQLRSAEAGGGGYFKYKGKVYTSEDKSKPVKKRPAGVSTTPAPGIKVKKRAVAETPVPTTAKKKGRAPGSYKYKKPTTKVGRRSIKASMKRKY